MSWTMAEPPTIVLSEPGDAPVKRCSDELLYELMPKTHIYDSNGENSVTDSEQMLLEANREITLAAATTGCLPTSNQCVIDLKYGGENYSDTSSYYSSDEYEGNDDYVEYSPKSNCSCKKCCSFCVGNDLNIYCTKHAHFKNAPRNGYFHTPTPVALLDLFCQRFEESYNFDIEIIIIYVNSVIDQLKRISNGDYLTSIAKERWMAVDSQMRYNNNKIEDGERSVTSIGEHELENEFCSFSPTWEGTLETQGDIRSLLENFERTVIKEVPRMLTDSEEISINNMDIETKPVKDSVTVTKDSKCNITIQIQPSLSGRLFRNFEALAQLEGSNITFTDSSSNDSFPLSELTKMNASLDLQPLKEMKSHHSITGAGISIVKIVEIIDITSDAHFNMSEERNKFDYLRTIPCDTISHNSSNTTVSLLDVLDKLCQATVNSQHPSPFNPTSADDLKATMQNLNIQSCLEEVSNEEGSLNNEEVPTKQKTKILKSPYESQRHAVDDKRRRRLLEIRENRGKKKLRMMHEKHSPKFGRGVKSHIAASSSVTRLSISNKSFYNSIFGQSRQLDIVNGRGQKVKVNRKLQKQKEMEDFAKHIKESTIIVHTRQKSKEKVLSNANAVESSEKEHRLKDLIDWKRQFEESKNKVLKQVDSLMSTESSNSCDMQGLAQSFGNEKSEHKLYDNNDGIQDPHTLVHNTYSVHHLKTSKNRVWKNKFLNGISSTKISTDSKILYPIEEIDRTTEKKHPSSFRMECRESIDKIYDLIRKIGITDNLASNITKTKFTTSTTNQPINSTFRTHGLPTQDSESATSVKHYSSTSFVSSSSTEKLNTISKLINLPKPIEAPKVIVISKNPTKEKKPESELARHHKKINHTILTKSSPKSPLRAMTKVLQEVNILPKTKQRTMQELRQPKLLSPNNRENPKRASRFDQHIRKKREEERVIFRVHQSRDKKGNEASKFLESTEKHGMQKKGTRELTDEEKESRGEAVRGPVTSRLNALAQPRKAYVKAHSEQFTNRHGRTIMADRLQRLVHAQPPQSPASIMNSNLRRCFPNELKTMNYTKIADKYERRSNSSPDSKTTSAQITEGILPKKGLKYIKKIPKDFVNTEPYWNTNSPTKYEHARNCVPLVPKNSEQDDFDREPSSELLIQDFMDILNSDQYTNEITDHGHSESFAVDDDVVAMEKMENSLPRTENVVAKIKNGKVSIDYEDLIDFDLFNLSNEHDEQPQPHNKANVGSLTTLQKVSRSTVIENCTHSETKSKQSFDHNFKKVTSPLTKIPSRNIFILQAGNASTVFTIKSSSVQNLLRKDILKVKSCTNLYDIKNFINFSNIFSVWDMGSLPRQISNVGYALPKPQKPNKKYESKTQHIANIIDYNIVHIPTEYNVCTRFEQAYIHQVPNGNAPIVPNAYEPIVSNDNENIVPNEKEPIVLNGKEQDVPNNKEPIVPNGYEPIVRNYKEPVVPNSNEPMVPNSKEVMVPNSKEFIVPNSKELVVSNSPIDDHTDKRSFGTDPIPNNEQNDYIGATGKLDCTSSLDVLFSLLNEIHSISTGKMQVAGMHGFQYVEHVKPVNFATIYDVKTTTERVTISFSEKTLDPIMCEDRTSSVDVPAKVSRFTDTSFIITAMSKGTCVTGLKLTDVTPVNTYEDARKESFELMNVYKKLNAVEPQNKENIVNKESVMDFRQNMKIKRRGILVSAYAILILAVFAAMSFPDILLIQS